MEITSNDQNNYDHYQFIYQKFSIYKKNKFLNKENYIKSDEKEEIKNNNNNTFDLLLTKAKVFTRYELEDINEFIQRKNFPERNKFKCFML